MKVTLFLLLLSGSPAPPAKVELPKPYWTLERVLYIEEAAGGRWVLKERWVPVLVDSAKKSK